MDIEKEFKEYLLKNNAKTVLKKIIDDGIEEYKSQPYYEWYDDGCPYDYSGSVRRVYGKTIGDMCNNDIEVLQALTGQSTPTYLSQHGLSWNNVADELTYRISDVFGEWTHDFIFENKNEVCKELGFKEELNEDNYFDILDSWDIVNGSIFEELFPNEYVIHHEDEYVWDDYLFSYV